MAIKTHEDFMAEVEKKNSKLKVVGKYINSRTKIEVECLLCKHHWFSSSGNILKGFGCPECQKRRNSKTNEEFLCEAEQKAPNIEIIDDYAGVNTKIRVKCKKCENIWLITPHNLLSGKGCPHCREKNMREAHKISNEEFLRRTREINPFIKPLEEYISAKHQLKCLCLKCKNTFYISPDKISCGHSCSICNLSKGERQIKKLLDKYEIDCIEQKQFNGLIGLGGGNLSYDFYIPAYKMLIEFQGLQHEKPVDFTGFGEEYAKEQFVIQQEHDRRKREYAKSNGYELLEIWHYDFDKIEQILNKALELNLSA